MRRNLHQTSMLKDISDEDAIEVAKILLKTPTSSLYNYEFEKLSRTKYDVHDGTDAEECVTVLFNATVKNKHYKDVGWTDEKLMIKLVDNDRYHDFPYFVGFYQNEKIKLKGDYFWEYKSLTNHIEATKYLLNKGIIN